MRVCFFLRKVTAGNQGRGTSQVLLAGVRGCVASQPKQDLLCGVCARVGPHLCSEEVASRTGELRAYGNAIVEPQAVEFVEAVIAFIRASLTDAQRAT